MVKKNNENETIEKLFHIILYKEQRTNYWRIWLSHCDPVRWGFLSKQEVHFSFVWHVI